MDNIFKKELALITKPIQELILEKLMAGFKNRQGRELHSVDSISGINIVIDEENSSLKEIVYVTKVLAFARIWVNFAGGRSSDNIQISFNQNLTLIYDFKLKEYNIDNPSDIKLIDRTN